MSAIIINLFGGPGSGKSTTASGVFYNLKQQGISAEFVQEYAKELVFEDRQLALANQVYILGKQFYGLYRVLDQVDVVVMDTSLLLGAVYAPADYYDSFTTLLFEIYHSMDNMNFFIERHKPYLEVGRYQKEDEAKRIDIDVRVWLDKNKVPYDAVPGTKEGVDKITEWVLEKLFNANL